jgi:flagellar motor switch protein FliM
MAEREEAADTADSASGPDTADVAADGNESGDAGVKAYDFGRSVWLATHRAEAFRQTAGEIARHTTELLSNWNAGWSVSAGELRVGRPDPARGADWALLHLTNWRERGMIMIDHSVSMSILVHLLGDPTIEIGPMRPLTPLEFSVIHLILDPLIDLTTSQLFLGSGARIIHVDGAEPAISGAESELTFFELEIDTGANQGVIALGLPAVSLQTFAEFVDRRQAGARSKSEGRTSPQALRVLGGVELEAIVRFNPFPVDAGTVTMLSEGDVLRTGHPVHRPLVAEIGGKALYLVEAGQRGERLVAEVVDIPNRSPGGVL